VAGAERIEDRQTSPTPCFAPGAHGGCRTALLEFITSAETAFSASQRRCRLDGIGDLALAER